MDHYFYYFPLSSRVSCEGWRELKDILNLKFKSFSHCFGMLAWGTCMLKANKVRKPQIKFLILIPTVKLCVFFHVFQLLASCKPLGFESPSYMDAYMAIYVGIIYLIYMIFRW